jgi:hypothetical protein
MPKGEPKMAEDERTREEDEVEAHRRHGHHATEEPRDSEDTSLTDDDENDVELHRRHHH